MSHKLLDREAVVRDGCLVLDSLRRKAMSGNVTAMKAFLDFAFSLEDEEKSINEHLLSDEQQQRIIEICREKNVTDKESEGSAKHNEDS